MEGGLAFGKTFGAVRRRCIRFSSLCLSWLCKKMLWWADLWNCKKEEGGWSPTFLRSYNDWEMEEVERFLSSIHKKKIIPWIKDKLLLKGSSHGNFSVTTMYSDLDLTPDIDFPSRSVWNFVIPFKISFFAWEAFWGKVITLD